MMNNEYILHWSIMTGKDVHDTNEMLYMSGMQLDTKAGCRVVALYEGSA